MGEKENSKMALRLGLIGRGSLHLRQKLRGRRMGWGAQRVRCQQGKRVCKLKLRSQLSLPELSLLCNCLGSAEEDGSGWGPAEHLRAVKEGQDGLRGAEKPETFLQPEATGAKTAQGEEQLDRTQLPDFP